MSYTRTIVSCNHDQTVTSIINIVNRPYTDTNTGHVRISASTDIGESYFESDITNINDNIPALYLYYAGSIEELGHGETTSRCGTQITFKIPTGVNTISESNVNSNNWYGIGGAYPIGSIFDNVLVGMSQLVPNIDQENYTNIFTIEADFPIFVDGDTTTPETYGEYVVANNTSSYGAEVCNGDDTHIDQARNFMDVADTIPNDKVWDIINYCKVNGNITETKAYCFKILPTAKIALYYDEQIQGDTSPNMHLSISEYPCKVKGFYQPDSAYTDANSVDSDYWWGHWTDYHNNDDIIGYGATNIPIFRSAAEVTKYFNGVIGIEDSINGGDSSVQTSTIGQPLTSTEIPSINLATSGVGCFAYALSEADIKDIMENYLFTDDQSLITTMQDALWTWGNNPIDFLIDCYYVPFSITSFYTTVTANLKFGNYQFPGTSFNAISETNGNRLELFNTTFEGTYGDWRDYTQFSYDLFLPYIGFVSLDPQKYVNHKVKCEMMFDITTHNVRYYLFVDGLITDRFDGSVGINIPLMATDIVNKAKHDRDIKYGLVTSALSTGTQIGMGLTSADIGGAMTGIVAGIGNIVNGVKQYQELGAKASSGVEGSFSSAMNVYDVSYAYLRITEEQMIIPAKTTQLYNHPSYYMGAVSSLSGYCELADIRFSSTATQPEIEEIQSLLRSGVIL